MNKRDILRIAYKAARRKLPLIDYFNPNIEFQKQFVDELPQVRVFPERNESKLEIISYLQQEHIGEDPIDYLEFGVYEGQTILKWADCNENVESRFYGFDSFEGLPESWKTGIERGTFSTDGAMPTTSDPRVTFVKGLFQETLPDFVRNFDGKSTRVIHLDADLYSSTLFALTCLDVLIEPGTYIIFDEFGDLLHEYRAFMDYTSSYDRHFELVAATGQCYKVVVKMAD